jgi:PPK2 family polyphosphate:nucleotide phosphotransferase
MKLKSPFRIAPHSKVTLKKISSSATPGYKEKDSDAALDKLRDQLNTLQEVFYASEAKALLIVLQGMDTAGKDGTIRHIFSGINPQGCNVASFKVPTPLEARHDFLWRCQAQAPPRGMIGIFNRSHYEQVLSPVVHGKLSHKQARTAMDDINAWEQTLADNGTLVLKFFLHISKDEQTARLQSRIDTPDKHWKLSPQTSPSASSGPTTSPPMKTSSRTPARNTRPGSSSRRTTSGTATSPSRRFLSTPWTRSSSNTPSPPSTLPA